VTTRRCPLAPAGSATAGVITERDGTVLGEHDGIDRFTIGAEGVEHRWRAQAFVLELLPESNTVVVGDESDLLASGLIGDGVNWLIDAPTRRLVCVAKIRYLAGVRATVTALPNGGAEVASTRPQPP